MADLPNIEFPPTMREIEASRNVLQASLTSLTNADTIAALSVDSNGPATAQLPATAPTPTPLNLQTPTPFSADDHVKPVEFGTLEFTPAFEEIDNLVDVWYIIHPDIKLYRWQKEELLRISGYVDGTLAGPRVHYTPQQAFRGSYCCCNGSGKDLALIATVAIGMPLMYHNVVVVVTSSSYEQLKFQTEAHIKRGLDNLHSHFGGLKVYDSIEFYHKCQNRGGEIKLFVTDEAGRAEGWHPFHPSGRLILIVNEAKSIKPAIFESFDRCDGYSHWLEISSPGPRLGLFYQNYLDAVHFPALPEPGKFFARKIDQWQCPHKSEEGRLQILRKHGEFSYVYQTSVCANFWELEEAVCIPSALFEAARNVVPNYDPDDIGIGMDSAAGRDEHTVFVRGGGKLLAYKAFVQKDTEAAAAIINEVIAPWKRSNYQFNADDGGVSHAMVDKLVGTYGWEIRRCHNQSGARNKSLYLNLGAEVYFHARRLFEAKLIASPLDEETRKQLCTRRFTETENQGKKALESKKVAKSKRGEKSPDRADGFCLCFYSYRPDALQVDKPPLPEVRRTMTTDQFIAACENDPAFLENLINSHDQTEAPKGDFTYQTVLI